jgi:hypothetical protein
LQGILFSLGIELGGMRVKYNYKIITKDKQKSANLDNHSEHNQKINPGSRIFVLLYWVKSSGYQLKIGQLVL